MDGGLNLIEPDSKERALEIIPHGEYFQDKPLMLVDELVAEKMREAETDNDGMSMILGKAQIQTCRAVPVLAYVPFHRSQHPANEKRSTYSIGTPIS